MRQKHAEKYKNQKTELMDQMDQMDQMDVFIMRIIGVSYKHKKGCCLTFTVLQQPGEQVLLEVLRFLFKKSVKFFKLFQNIFLTCAFEQVSGFTALRDVVGQKSQKR